METGEGVSLYAPSLACLAPNATLLMATLPLLDWNGALMDELQGGGPSPKSKTVAAILACDPFACWVDFVDSLRRANIGAVANFPPIAMTAGPGMVDLDAAGFSFQRELDRLAWFGGQGFDVVVVVGSHQQAEDAWERLGATMRAAWILEASDADRAANVNIVLTPGGKLERPGMAPIALLRLVAP